MAAAGAVWSEAEPPTAGGMRWDQRPNLVTLLDRLLGKGGRSCTAVLGSALRQAAHRYFGAKTVEGAP